ncbi:MmcQ/YjbR family DNA-binding protein, partial [bacterium]|nr:MmcQ/YjbR family DNA-binding protein [bacterium]
MDFESIRKFCLSLTGVTEDIQWEKDLLFRIGGKMFAVIGLEPEPDNVAFKCTPEDFAELTTRNGI